MIVMCMTAMAKSIKGFIQMIEKFIIELDTIEDYEKAEVQLKIHFQSMASAFEYTSGGLRPKVKR